MRKTFLCSLIAVQLTCTLGMAQFVDDDFSAPVLGSQWTWHDSTPAGSTYTLTGSKLQMKSKEGSDFWMMVDGQCYVEQAAPTGTNWEVVTKIDSFDPMTSGAKRTFIRTGIQLWQDDAHWVSIGILGNDNGTNLGVQAFWQTDPVPARHSDRFCGWSEYWPVTTSPLYLKIQKTTRGYLAQMSGDGAAWTNVLPMVMNPETADGSFTNEKVRLYQSGGPATGTGVCSPAEFDYARAAAIASVQPTPGCKNDEFAGSALDPATWGYYEGVQHGTMSVSGGKLLLKSGNEQDLWFFVDKATHVYQDAPSSAACALVTKVGPSDLRSYEQWNALGIRYWQDQCNWALISIQRSELVPPTNRLEIGFKRGEAFDAYNIEFGANPAPEYLQIEKAGQRITVAYSYDNTAWTRVAGFTYPAVTRSAQVQLYSKGVFSGAKATGEFDWFRVELVTTGATDWALFE
jgi:hypothetical protein